jgi:four helix bundle protein
MAQAIETHEDLDVWQVSMELAEHCYRLTARFPHSELYGLSAQPRRAAVSIPSSFAEGFGRDRRGSFVECLRTAQGSSREMKTQSKLVVRLGLAPSQDAARTMDRCMRVSKMLRALIRKLDQ